jgi:hypothetical protein
VYDPPLTPIEQRLFGVVWLTTDSITRHQKWVSPPQKREVRIAVEIDEDDPNLLTWPRYAATLSMPPNQFAFGNQGWANWRVYLGTLPQKQLVAWSDTATESWYQVEGVHLETRAMAIKEIDALNVSSVPARRAGGRLARS